MRHAARAWPDAYRGHLKQVAHVELGLRHKRLVESAGNVAQEADRLGVDLAAHNRGRAHAERRADRRQDG